MGQFSVEKPGLPGSVFSGNQQAPPIGMHWQPEFIAGIGKWKDEFIVVPNLERIFN